jgi:hypothetical protein
MSNGPAKKPSKKPLNDYIRFSAMGIQMGVTILLMTLLGMQIDRYLQIKHPVFTIFMALASAGGVMYYFIRQSSRNNH